MIFLLWWWKKVWEVCNRETLWFSNSTFTEYLNIKTSASVPLPGDSEVTLHGQGITLTGISRVLVADTGLRLLSQSCWLSLPGSPPPLPISLLVNSTCLSTRSPLWRCFSPGLKPCHHYQPAARASWVWFSYTVKAVNVIDFWLQRR